jgi:hypothetical protein
LLPALTAAPAEVVLPTDRYQLTGTGLSTSITVSGTKFFKDDDLN